MSSTLQVAVIGAGTMGRGIVQLFVEAGHSVRCFDTQPGAALKALESVTAMLNKLAAKGRYSDEQVVQMQARMQACESVEQLEGCNLAIEAIVENLAAKQSLFKELERVLGSEAILTSNTSSLMVADIAAACSHPERVAGLHFFNPVPLMKVVEVIAAVRTSAATVELLQNWVAGTGHRAVVAADQPGFLVNHAGRGLYTEGLRILEENVASVSQVDTLLRSAAGFRMGPFELLDLTGLDVSGKVMESIYQQFQQEPRFRPSSLVAPRIAAGLYGRKSTEGWYSYAQDKAPVSEAPRALVDCHGSKVWIDPTADEAEALEQLVLASDAQLCADLNEADVLLVQFWGTDVARYCARHKLDAKRTVAVDPLPGLHLHRTLMLSPLTTAHARDIAVAILGQDDHPLSVIGDSLGFVVQRVLATIVNIAADIAQRRIARVADLEDAVQLGLGYPRGPLSWGDQIGGERVLAILEQMHAASGDPRYRASPWLARRAQLGVSLLTEEAAR